MQQKIIFRHLSGSRVNQVDEFPANVTEELTLGRNPDSKIRFDPNQDDLVGRKHAIVMSDPSEAGTYNLADLNSRNGTYVNRQRIYGTTRIHPGDVVQLGPGGPEFRFELDPPAAGATGSVRATRLAEGPAVPSTSQVPPTREGAASPIRPSSAPIGGGSKRPIGRTTVERMIGQVQARSKGDARKALFVAAGSFFAIAALAAVGYLAITDQLGQMEDDLIKGVEASQTAIREEIERNERRHEKALKDLKPPEPPPTPIPDPDQSLPPQKISQNYGKSVVFLEVAWHLVDTVRGRHVRHVYNSTQVIQERFDAQLQSCAEDAGDVPCDLSDAQLQDLRNGKEWLDRLDVGMLPVYFEIGTSVFPVLVYDDWIGPNGWTAKPIAGQLTGSGFVYSSNGYVLTNRHVATPWHHKYSLPTVGLVLSTVHPKGRLTTVDMSNWVPSKQNIVLDATNETGLDIGVLLDRERKKLSGDYTRFLVGFPKSSTKRPARLIQISQTQDVALIKVDAPEPLKPVKLSQSPRGVRQGDGVVVMSYPGTAPVEGTMVADGSLEGGSTFVQIPSPSLSEGVISRILQEKAGVTSQLGDFFQLSAGPGIVHGSSGGPVFDKRNGSVIGLLTLLSSHDGQTYAVPIDYAFPLVGLDQERD